MSARPPVLLAALFLAALALASCGSDEPAPLAPAIEDTTTSMLVIDGVPRVSVSLDASLTEATSDGAVTGFLRAVVEDSTGFRVFLPRVRLNGVALVDETDGLGNPAQSRLDFETALPGFQLSDSLRFAVEDGGIVTPPFTLRLALSRVELLPDASVVSRTAPLRFRWSGRIERLVLTLTDQFGTRVRANLTFENYSGLREVVLPARDLAVLAPGPVTVAASITDSELRFPGPRLITVNYLSAQRRAWTLTP